MPTSTAAEAQAVQTGPVQTSFADEDAYLAHVAALRAARWPEGLPRTAQYPLGEIPISDYLTRRAQANPDKPAINFYGRVLSFGDLDRLSDRFAAHLATLGFKPGDRVAVFLPNCPQFLIAFYGILKAGCIHVPVNPMFKELELAYELNDTAARLIVVLDQLYPLVEAVRGRTSLERVYVTSFADMAPDGEPLLPPPAGLFAAPRDCPGADGRLIEVLDAETGRRPDHVAKLDDWAAINYTGGTTGMPKGCIHTQRDMVYTSAASASFVSPGDETDVLLNFLPVFWIAGENLGVLLPVFTGSTMVLLARWDGEAVLAAIERCKVSRASMIMDNIVELMDRPDIATRDLSSLKSTTTISFVKKLNPEFRRRWRDLTGLVLRETSYGMTETHTSDTFTTGMQTDDYDLKSAPVFCGFPVPGTEIKICDFETGVLKDLGVEGEVLIRGPSLLKGYLNKPQATADSLVAGGWLRTGDIGVVEPDGSFRYLGRRKEMLKVKGMSVFPSEIETLLGQHPAIAGSAVIGRPDADKGEVPVAFVRLDPDRAEGITADVLDAWCRKSMAIYKVPEFRIVETLPMTATGKVKKEELAAQL
ncbi:acyl-CoA synthetase [Tistrella bauzanensis]|uniref:Acyl-CoA synthetase n=1 Tax=Tistrella bauzanensis TaxID=657419 RepID=A0ABQ1I6X2_9PROT|nr:AMP-binding protein [Tistrella bauzanensis]GGB22941.1 acyl-CoA synthetase [Tistrella bauzanensis]